MFADITKEVQDGHRPEPVVVVQNERVLLGIVDMRRKTPFTRIV